MHLEGKVWGSTTHLFSKNNVEVNHISVKKGGYCSKHYHQSKFNKFIVKYGKLKVEIEKEGFNDVTILKDGMDFTVKPGEAHWFEALEDTEALEIYWVELSKDDIKRVTSGGIRESAVQAKVDANMEKSAIQPEITTNCPWEEWSIPRHRSNAD